MSETDAFTRIIQDFEEELDLQDKTTEAYASQIAVSVATFYQRCRDEGVPHATAARLTRDWLGHLYGRIWDDE